MTQNASLLRRQQSLTPGREIQLFTLDTSAIEKLDGSGYGSVYRFCSSFRESSRTITFNSLIYTPIAIEATGFETLGKGVLPSPRLKIANTNLEMTTIMQDLGDPVGAQLTRFLTFEPYLDDGDEPDPEAIFLPQVYLIDRKVKETRQMVEFELSASMDQAGRMLPKRQILRDACTHIYRRWDASAVPPAFDYSKATCPWQGDQQVREPADLEAPYFLNDDTKTNDPSLDNCGKRLRSCEVRHAPEDGSIRLDLPTRAFPGVARIKSRR
jgi:lambda family phage minor tail protein L